jgi:hypothetical protein
MRVPHVTERIKEAPVQALRGVLAGIGQVLLFTDKLRNKNAETAPAGDDASGGTATATAEAPVAAESTETAEAEVVAEAEAATSASAEAATAEAAPEAATATAEPTEAAPTAEEPAAEAAPAPAKAAAAKTRKPRKPRDPDKTGNVRVITEEEAPAEAEASAETAAPAAEVAAELPMPTYDDLTVASIRARLRNLTAAQVATLADYEKAHAARPEVITMFERRIAKLAAEG